MRKSKTKASNIQVLPDRLSDLPDCILVHILSLLNDKAVDIRAVVKTSLLSKRWRNLWTNISHLYFFDESPELVNGALAQLRGAKIRDFRLYFMYARPLFSDIDSWLLFAIDKQVENLSLDLGRYRAIFKRRYRPPQRLYSCPSITKLSLFRCELKIDNNVSVQWNQLKSLRIEGEKSLSADALNRVLAAAPHLEELYLKIYHSSENFSIRSRSLKILEIDMQDLYGKYFGEIVVKAVLRVWAPNLLTLRFMDFSCCCCCFLDVPSLTDANFYVRKRIESWESWDFSTFEIFIHVFGRICHADKVTLSDWCIKCLLYYMKKKDMFMPSSNAKILKLYAADAEEMLDVLHMFPKLMVLIVKRDPNWTQITEGGNTRMAIVDQCMSLASRMAFSSLSLLQLKTVEFFYWSICTDSITPAIEILLQNAHMLEKMVFQVAKYNDMPEPFTLALEKIQSLPRSSPYAKVITRSTYP